MRALRGPLEDPPRRRDLLLEPQRSCCACCPSGVLRSTSRGCRARARPPAHPGGAPTRARGSWAGELLLEAGEATTTDRRGRGSRPAGGWRTRRWQAWWERAARWVLVEGGGGADSVVQLDPIIDLGPRRGLDVEQCTGSISPRESRRRAHSLAGRPADTGLRAAQRSLLAPCPLAQAQSTTAVHCQGRSLARP